MLTNESLFAEPFNETELICPEYGDDDNDFLEKLAFWIEGVVLCVIGCPGIFGNALSAYILAGKSMRNSFNLLLIALAMIDNTYLFASILEACRKRFNLQTDLHLLLFPYFLYPLHSMAMTGSILMTVAIALERYNAVHWPISYSQVRLLNKKISNALCIQCNGGCLVLVLRLLLLKWMEVSAFLSVCDMLNSRYIYFVHEKPISLTVL